LTKLGYLIDNPWNNALDRAKAAGGVLADMLIRRQLGVRPITLIGFSLGARVIFYALIELAKHKAFGIVQDVFLLGATLTTPTEAWCQARSVVSGRHDRAPADRHRWHPRQVPAAKMTRTPEIHTLCCLPERRAWGKFGQVGTNRNEGPNL